MADISLDVPALPGPASYRLAAWRVRPGQAILRGATLCEVVEGAKRIAVPALRAGIVRKLLSAPGQMLASGDRLALLAGPATGWTKRLVVPSGTLAIRRWGGAPGPAGSFLMLHGFGGMLGTWNGVAAPLAARGCAVFAPDLPAHGDTLISADTPAAIAKALLRALDHVPGGVGNPHLVGHSLGAAVALLMAEAAPRRFSSLTLLAPAGLGAAVSDAFLSGLLAATDTAALRDVLSKLTPRLIPAEPAALAAMLTALDRHRPALTRLAAALRPDGVALDLSDKLAALPIPTRIVAGTKDAVVEANALNSPPRVPLHLLECGHMPHWERLGAIRRLLARIAEFDGG